jgi:hypothetical protein
MKVSEARECDASNCAAQCGEDDTGSVCGGPSPSQKRGDDITESIDLWHRFLHRLVA